MEQEREVHLIKGRGVAANPKNRFEKVRFRDETGETRAPGTRVSPDQTKSIIAHNDSPDVGFEFSVNPYRGCEHGCVYCYARPTHEYLGLSSGVDFESRIFVKERADELLRKELSSAKWTPRTIAISGVTDAYQPVEREYEITRKCLRVLADFKNPVSIITKNHLVVRDLDILKELASQNLIHVTLSITSLDETLASKLEPRASRPPRRLRAVETLAQAGIPTGVNVAPLIPGLTDHEIPAILKAAANAGAGFCGYTLVRLPYAVVELFEDWLESHYPLQKQKVLNRIRELRDGKLNDSDFGSRMQGKGPYAKQIESLFALSARRFGLSQDWPQLLKTHFKVPGVVEQLSLF